MERIHNETADECATTVIIVLEFSQTHNLYWDQAEWVTK